MSTILPSLLFNSNQSILYSDVAAFIIIEKIFSILQYDNFLWRNPKQFQNPFKHLSARTKLCTKHTRQPS